MAALPANFTIRKFGRRLRMLIFRMFPTVTPQRPGTASGVAGDGLLGCNRRWSVRTRGRLRTRSHQMSLSALDALCQQAVPPPNPPPNSVSSTTVAATAGSELRHRRPSVAESAGYAGQRGKVWTSRAVRTAGHLPGCYRAHLDGGP